MTPFDEGSSDNADAGDPERPGPRCPICSRPMSEPHRPFCSRRCADIDLHRWLSGVYSVPTTEPPEDGEQDKDNKAEP